MLFECRGDLRTALALWMIGTFPERNICFLLPDHFLLGDEGTFVQSLH